MKTSKSLSYSFFCLIGSWSLNLQEPKAPPGVCLSFDMVAFDSLDVSINSSFKAPKMPFLPARTLLIFEDLLAVSITPHADALITEVTPPDCA